MLQPLQPSVAIPPSLPADIERRLGELVSSPSGKTNPVSEAVRYSVLSPGKRLRPSMLVLATESLGGQRDSAIDPACAVEMVHTASLILDDLPCMDNAATRRGRPSCHAEFGVDTATLAAIALLNRAYFVIATAEGVSNATRTSLVKTLARAISDCSGMVAGQLKDLRSAPGSTDVDDVRTLVTEKTGELFVCAADMGGRLAEADEITLEALREFARKFGLCFQVLDDLADLESSTRRLGKDVRKDDGKATFATLLGPVAARRAAREFASESSAALASVGLADSALADLARVDVYEPAGLGVRGAREC